MGVRERKIEQYLDKRINDIGGLTRKWVSPGRDGVPDRIVIYKGQVYFIEIKTVDGTLSKNQKREIKRLIDKGANVEVLYGNIDINSFIELLKELLG